MRFVNEVDETEVMQDIAECDEQATWSITEHIESYFSNLPFTILILKDAKSEEFP